MVAFRKEGLKLFLVFLVLSLPVFGFARPNESIVTRRWVSKLKQNTFFNRRSFQFASPIFKNEKVFVGIHKGFFQAIHAKRGKKLWKFEAQAPIYAKAGADETAVYFADSEGIAYALDQNSGDPLWMTGLGAPILSAPLIVGEKIYFVSLLKELSCLDIREGKILWQETFGTRDPGFTIQGSADPVLFGSSILVGYSDGLLIAHDLADGSVRWTKQLGDRFSEFHDVDSTPFIVADEEGAVAYISSADGKLFALRPESGQILWETEAGGDSDLFVSPPYLYVAQGGKIACFDSKKGEILWEQDFDVPGLSSPVVYKDWVVVSATKGKTYFLDKKVGDVVYSWYIRGGSYGDPVLAGDRIFLLSNASRLYAFQFK